MPLFAATISANTRPRNAKPAPTRSPVMMPGSAAGRIAYRSTCSRFAPSERSALTRICGAVRTPSSVLYRTGKNTT